MPNSSPDRDRAAQVAALYPTLHALLRVRVQRRPGAPDLDVDDATSIAWERLLASQDMPLDNHAAVLAWLTTTACRELDSARSGVMRTAQLSDQLPAQADVETTVQLRDELALRTIPAQLRRPLLMQALGFSRDEIAAVTDSPGWSVSASVRRARRILRTDQQRGPSR